ncbi:MAG: transcription termination factor Rho [Lachnospiraceae bacterium]|nr:transcription termination factor Rho [Lachnospiraceae bacterium]
MREKLMSLPLAELREIAKAGGLKGITGLKKEALVELMIAEDSRRKSADAAEDAAKAEIAAKAVRIDRKEASEKPEASVNRTEENRAVENKSAEENDEAERPAKQERSNKADGRRTNQRSSRVASPSPERRYAEAAKEARESRDASKTEAKNETAAVQDKVEERTSAELKQDQAKAEQPKTEQPKQEPGVYVMQEGDSPVTGILEVMPEGYGFIRSDNYLPGDQDVYVSPVQIRSFRLKTGDVLTGIKKAKGEKEKFSPLAFIEKANGRPAREVARRTAFENLTPIFPDHRIKLETPGCSVAMRAMDLVSPVGKGQRGMIVSPPKAGKTSLLKEVAHSMLRNDPLTHLLILLIDERPEEVTDIKEAIIGQNVEVIYSTFDEQPEHHMRVAEMVIERAKRLVELGEDVVILLDSITRLTRAYNQVIPPSGRTLSGGLDPAALHMPKRFFGAARNMREGGSLTILATALVETGSKMDDVVYEEFKGTGNMEIILDRKLSEKRIFPAIDLAKSGTRREDLLLNADELEAINIMRKALNGLKPDEATDRILNMFANTRNNSDFVQLVKKNKFL